MEPQRLPIDMKLQRAPTLLTASLLKQPSLRRLSFFAPFSEMTIRVVNELGWEVSCNADQALFVLFARPQFPTGKIRSLYTP